MNGQADGLLSAFLRTTRIQRALPFIKGKVLDVGCGVGKLAEYIGPENYVGIDKDPESVNTAKEQHPNHKFYLSDRPDTIEDKFDTVVALAVIEHVDNPIEFMIHLKSLLATKGLIVITTPHPRSDFIHHFGSSIGLFSRLAHEEHKELLDKDKMSQIAHQANLRLIAIKTFLLGMNQLFVLAPAE